VAHTFATATSFVSMAISMSTTITVVAIASTVAEVAELGPSTMAEARVGAVVELGPGTVAEAEVVALALAELVADIIARGDLARLLAKAAA